MLVAEQPVARLVVDTATPSVLVASEQVATLVSEITETRVLVAAAQQGPGGPPGPSSPATSYVHDQSSADVLWIINHNLGVQPAIITVMTPGGSEIEGDVLHISVNQLRISFAAPQNGRARMI